ncbi:MAG: aldehyde dehydrogenase family protein [Elusimicrobia bacterium]|nr:aldehyde dehydrogenase family protein [Elusimicrobiota bacterium]
MISLTKPEQAGELAAALARGAGRAWALPSHSKSKMLERIARGIESDSEGFARLIVEEVAKPLKEARREVSRAAFTFDWASEEAKRFGGELLPLDLDLNTEGRFALTRRFPRGPALFITPFNFPLNLVAHKVAAAIAVGVPWALKPAPQAPRTAERLGELILEAGWPKECMAVVSCSNELAEGLVRDPNFGVLSFTGSDKVGWHLKSVAGKKHAILELGGNAAAYVAPDADLAWAAARIAWGAFYYSGQVCISVQRVLVHAKVYEPFKEMLLKNISELVIGEPGDERTDIGPLISEESAKRVEAWIQEAVSAGGRLLAGGRRQGRLIFPTLVENVPSHAKLSCQEAFGPVATIEPVDSRERALERIGEGGFGLQAGLFTNDLKGVFDAWNRVPVGGLILNDIPAFRSDAMPYGGVRDSGTGREGVRYAMEELTERRTLVLRP